jgi:HPP family
MAVTRLFAAPGMDRLCLRKLLHHSRAARIARLCHGQPVCVSIARSNCVSLLLPTDQSLQPAPYPLGPRYWARLWLRSLRAYNVLRSTFQHARGVHGPTILAAALSLSATGAFMVLFRVSHPPAGATTLIVSLGIISQPKDLVIIEAAVVLLTAQALAINRLAGLPYPLWREGTPPGTSS